MEYHAFLLGAASMLVVVLLLCGAFIMYRKFFSHIYCRETFRNKALAKAISQIHITIVQTVDYNDDRHEIYVEARAGSLILDLGMYRCKNIIGCDDELLALIRAHTEAIGSAHYFIRYGFFVTINDMTVKEAQKKRSVIKEKLKKRRGTH
jgi:hypothetical protein